jgi:hypothetical protein
MDAPLLGAKGGNPDGAYGAMRPPTDAYDGVRARVVAIAACLRANASALYITLLQMTRVADTRDVHRPVFDTNNSSGVYCCTTPLAACLGIACCPFTLLGSPVTIPPRHEAVGTVFGKYVATWRQSGLYFVNPCGLNLRYVSINNRTHELQSIKVADAAGNSLVVSGVITFRGECPAFAIVARLRVLTRVRYPFCLSQ